MSLKDIKRLLLTDFGLLLVAVSFDLMTALLIIFLSIKKCLVNYYGKLCKKYSFSNEKLVQSNFYT